MSIDNTLKYTFILLLTALLVPGYVQSQGMQSKGTHPNILFILVDDLGKEWVSSYGAVDIQTPNVDALAKSGMRFNNVYAMPQCTPTRLTLLTGQYPFRHGWVNHWDVPRWGGGAHFDETKYPSLPLEMQKAGYKTCIAGKWQIDDFRIEPDALKKAGFDEYCMWTGYETGIPASAERYQDPYIFTKEGSKTYIDQFGPDVFKDFIIDFIGENKEQPMFIYFPMVLTHTPLIDTPDEKNDTNLGKHKAMVRYADKILGELLATLEKHNLRENTLIIWTADNGTTQGITGTLNGRKVKGSKAKTTEPGICMPFIASWLSQKQIAKVSDALVDFTDIFPTFLDLAGHNYSTRTEGKVIDGKSFKDVLTGKSKKSDRDWILGMGGGNNAKLTNMGVENQYIFRDRVIRNERFKLYLDANRKVSGFYDLSEDMSEENNLLGKLTTRTQKRNFKRLKKVIKTFPEQDADPLYDPNPAQEWDVEITAESQVWKK
jgi:arylsulfatase A-like enzyme